MKNKFKRSALSSSKIAQGIRFKIHHCWSYFAFPERFFPWKSSNTWRVKIIFVIYLLFSKQISRLLYVALISEKTRKKGLMKNKDSPSELISTYFKQTASSENPVVVILWQLLSKEVVYVRVSVQGVKSLGGHFACLCRGFEFY